MIFYLKTNLSLKRSNLKVIFTWLFLSMPTPAREFHTVLFELLPQNYEFLIDTFESKNNCCFSGYKYLAEFLFYVLLIVFKSSQKQFHFFSLQDFFIIAISENTVFLERCHFSTVKISNTSIVKSVILGFWCF